LVEQNREQKVKNEQGKHFESIEDNSKNGDGPNEQNPEHAEQTGMHPIHWTLKTLHFEQVLSI
jgi:hypothetical protein